jgi:chaperonin cofactor prefoldin
MRCKEARQEHGRLVSIASKLVEQDTWLARRIGEVSQDASKLDLVDKLIDEQTASSNRLQEIRSKMGQIEKRFRFLKSEAVR